MAGTPSEPQLPPMNFRAGSGKRRKSSFLKKKKQKTFIRLGRLLDRVLALRQIDKSFCFFFSKKKTSFSS